MSQILFEFGAESPRSILDALTLATENAKYDVKVLLPEDVESIEYRKTKDTIESAGRKLQRGEIASLLVYPHDGTIRYAMMSGPKTWGEDFSLWYGAIEAVESSVLALFNRLLTVQLLFVSLAMEESLELRNEHLQPGKFPWTEPQLIIAAVRSNEDDGNWRIEHGPAFVDSGVN